MLRCSISAACILLLLVLVLAALWAAFDWPPPRLILKYGFPPTGGPTGRALTIEGVEFVELKPGYFRMGSHARCKEGDLLGRVCDTLHLPWGRRPSHDKLECPPHWVELERPFWIGRTELTKEQYNRFDPDHTSGWPVDGCPVTRVSWTSARAYCRWLSARSGYSVCLPTEAEWEYACRAGSQADYCFGDDRNLLREYAWFRENSDSSVHAAGTLRPNSWNLYDMHGNAYEWVDDTYHWSYDGAPDRDRAWTENPVLSEDGKRVFRVYRSHAADEPAEDCRSAYRWGCEPSSQDAFLGFRPAIRKE